MNAKPWLMLILFLLICLGAGSLAAFLTARGVREWYPGGAPAAEGFYLAGERDGRWRFWDPHGQVTAEITYKDGVRISPPAGDMLPRAP